MMQTKFKVIFVLLVVTMLMGQSSTQDGLPDTDTLPMLESTVKFIFDELHPDENGLLSIDGNLLVKFILVVVKRMFPERDHQINLSPISTGTDSNGDEKLSLDEVKEALRKIGIVFLPDEDRIDKAEI